VDGVSFGGVVEYYAATLATDVDANENPNPPNFDENNINTSIWQTTVEMTGFGKKDNNGVDYKYLWNVEGIISKEGEKEPYTDYLKDADGNIIVDLYMTYTGGRIPKNYISYYAVNDENEIPVGEPELDANNNNIIINSSDWVLNFEGSGDQNTYLFEISFVEYADPDENGKNKYAKISGPMLIGYNGIDGGSLDVQYAKAVSVDKITNWQTTIPTNLGENEKIFMRQKLSTSDTWSNPIQISGEDGKPGKDGANIEYVYYRSKTAIPALSAPDIRDIQPYPTTITDSTGNQWYPSPVGITEIWKYEYMSVRTKPAGNDTQWTPFSTPVIWSKWGDKGLDGDGVEYKFYLKNEKTKPNYSSADTNWKDEPQGVTAENRFEYVAVISTKHNENGEAQTSSKVTLWNEYLTSPYTIELSNDSATIGATADGTINSVLLQTISANFLLLTSLGCSCLYGKYISKNT
jgi:hypothetical protein